MTYQTTCRERWTTWRFLFGGIILLLGLTTLLGPSPAYADEVLDWNAVLTQAVLSVPGPFQFRSATIVEVAVYDAVNGIERRFTPIHVKDEAPRGSSQRAAAVQAAYTALVALFPAQSDLFSQQLEASLAAIAVDAIVAVESL